MYGWIYVCMYACMHLGALGPSGLEPSVNQCMYERIINERKKERMNE
jgi:hypothetical protein